MESRIPQHLRNKAENFIEFWTTKKIRIGVLVIGILQLAFYVTTLAIILRIEEKQLKMNIMFTCLLLFKPEKQTINYRKMHV